MRPVVFRAFLITLRNFTLHPIALTRLASILLLEMFSGFLENYKQL